MPKYTIENHINFVTLLSSIELDSFYTRPTDVCIDTSIFILKKLNELNLNSNSIKVSPSPDGEIVIEFFKDLKYYSFDVFDDEIYFCGFDDVKEVGIDEITNLLKKI